MSTLALGQATIEQLSDPESFYADHAGELDQVGAAAFCQSEEVFAGQVAERFRRATLAQVMRHGEQIAGFALYDKLPSRHGCVLSVEGRAIRPEFQGQGFGTMALQHLLESHGDIQAAASVTRNPAVLRLMRKGFMVVSPDLDAPNPLHYIEDDDAIREVSEMYSQYVGADPADTPFVFNRYEGGLYGSDDPGSGMTALPQIAGHPDNGVVMAATIRRSLP